MVLRTLIMTQTSPYDESAPPTRGLRRSAWSRTVLSDGSARAEPVRVSHRVFSPGSMCTSVRGYISVSRSPDRGQAPVHLLQSALRTGQDDVVGTVVYLGQEPPGAQAPRADQADAVAPPHRPHRAPHRTRRTATPRGARPSRAPRTSRPRTRGRRTSAPHTTLPP